MLRYHEYGALQADHIQVKNCANAGHAQLYRCNVFHTAIVVRTASIAMPVVFDTTIAAASLCGGPPEYRTSRDQSGDIESIGLAAEAASGHLVILVSHPATKAIESRFS